MKLINNYLVSISRQTNGLVKHLDEQELRNLPGHFTKSKQLLLDFTVLTL